MKAGGCTPMGEAMWWAMREALERKEARKIILVVTDGCPDSKVAAEKAVAHGRRLGLEFCGIANPEIMNLLPESSEVVDTLDQLAPALFRILQRTLAG